MICYRSGLTERTSVERAGVEGQHQARDGGIISSTPGARRKSVIEPASGRRVYTYTLQDSPQRFKQYSNYEHCFPNDVDGTLNIASPILRATCCPPDP